MAKRDYQLSVILPVYNSQRFLGQAIESILNQTYSDFELIIIDDASTDDSANIVSQFAKQDSRIRVVTHSSNHGLAATLNECITLSSGKYIARMDNDDISLPNRFMEQLTYMKNHPNISVCGTWADLIDEESRTIGHLRPETNPVLLKWQALFNNPLVHPTVIFLKKDIKQSGSYPNSKIEDYALWSSIIHKINLINIPLTLLKYRIHQHSFTKRNKAEVNRWKEDIILKNIWHYYPISQADFKLLRSKLPLSLKYFDILGKKRAIYIDIMESFKQKETLTEDELKKINKQLRQFDHVFRFGHHIKTILNIKV